MHRASVLVPGLGYSTCHVYADRTPLLDVSREAVLVTLSPAEGGSITRQEVAFARALARNAECYAQECARFAEQAAGRLGEEPLSGP